MFNSKSPKPKSPKSPKATKDPKSSKAKPAKSPKTKTSKSPKASPSRTPASSTATLGDASLVEGLPVPGADEWVALTAEAIATAALDGPLVDPAVVARSKALLVAHPQWCHGVLGRTPAPSPYGPWPALERHEPYLLVLAARALVAA